MGEMLNTIIAKAGKAGIGILNANLKGFGTFPVSFIIRTLSNKLIDHLTEKEFINCLENTPPKKLNQDRL